MKNSNIFSIACFMFFFFGFTGIIILGLGCYNGNIKVCKNTSIETDFFNRYSTSKILMPIEADQNYLSRTEKDIFMINDSENKAMNSEDDLKTEKKEHANFSTKIPEENLKRNKNFVMLNASNSVGNTEYSNENKNSKYYSFQPKTEEYTVSSISKPMQEEFVLITKKEQVDQKKLLPKRENSKTSIPTTTKERKEYITEIPNKVTKTKIKACESENVIFDNEIFKEKYLFEKSLVYFSRTIDFFYSNTYDLGLTAKQEIVYDDPLLTFIIENDKISTEVIFLMSVVDHLINQIVPCYNENEYMYKIRVFCMIYNYILSNTLSEIKIYNAKQELIFVSQLDFLAENYSLNVKTRFFFELNNDGELENFKIGVVRTPKIQDDYNKDQNYKKFDYLLDEEDRLRLEVTLMTINPDDFLCKLFENPYPNQIVPSRIRKKDLGDK